MIGGAGKSGSLSLAAARDAGATRTVGVVPHEAEAALLRDSGLADEVVVADARDPIALRDAVAAAGGPADVTVVCVDVPGCEGGAILATAEPAARSSSSRWPRRSPPPRSAPRAWRPT